MKTYGIDPIVVDPLANASDALREYQVKLAELSDITNADCVIVAVAHREFKELRLDDIKRLYKHGNDCEKVLLDVKGLYTIKDLDASGMRYWRL